MKNGASRASGASVPARGRRREGDACGRGPERIALPALVMGTLRNSTSGATFDLLAETRIGRGAGNDLALTSGSVSKTHALVRWRGDAFVLRDTGSTNGTWLGRNRLAEGQELPLAVGNVLVFGSDGETWDCVDVTPPATGSVLATDRLRYALAACALHVGPPNTVLLIAGEQRHKLALSPGEYNVVRALAEQRRSDRDDGVAREGWVIRKDFGDEVCSSVQTLNQHIKRIRAKVQDLDVLAEDGSAFFEQVDGEIRLGVSDVRVE